MKMMKSMLMMCMLLVAAFAHAGESAPFVLDTRAATVVSSADLAYNSSWIGGDSSAAVVICENGTEVYRGSGVGDYKWTPATSGKHTFTYTTYIDGIAQDEVYEVMVYANWKYEVQDGKAILIDALEALLDSDKVVIPSEIDGYVVGSCAAIRHDGVRDVTMPVFGRYVGAINKNNWIQTDDVYQSNRIGSNGSTSMSIEIVGPVDFKFDWKVSSEDRYDKLKWYLNGVQKSEISGTGGDWATVECSLPEGNHAISWTYSKDGSYDNGDDCGWVRFNSMLDKTISYLFPNSYASITNVSFIGEVKEIPANMFAGCSALASFAIPEGVTTIGISAFEDCKNLTSVIIPNSVSNIAARAFRGCCNLSNVILSEKVEKIGFNAFDGCVGIKDVTISIPHLIVADDVPGLKQAKFDSNNDFSSSILDSPTCVNVSGVLMGNAYDTESVTRTYSDPLYGGSYKWNSRNTTFGYYGHMYMIAGRKYVFGKYFDDSVLVRIDGVEVLKNTDYTAFATGCYTPETTGWHEIEVRLADGSGEKGPKGVQDSYYWSGNLGVGWRDDGITDALPESGWKKLMDPGDGSLFRFYDDSYSVSGMNQLFPSSYVSITNVTLTGDVLMLPVDRFVGCESLETVRLADSSLVLQLGGENGWCINDNGVLQSAKIDDNEESSTEITVKGSGKLSFRWKASSEYYGEDIYDYAYLTIDGVETDLMIGGHTDWEEVEVDVRGDGLHTIKWIYAKDEVDQINLGEDCAWVDSIKFRPNRTVSFDIGLASGDAPKASSDISETVIKLPEYVGFDRPKYTLIGWSDGKDVYAPNSDYSIPVTNITLVAVYEANTIAEPTITSEEVENGGVIDTASAMFSITADAGTAIYYTLDGSTPTAASRHYTRRFSVELLGDVTIKAIAIRDNYFDSPVATFTFKRLPYSAAECLNIDFCEALNGGDSNWFRVLGDEAHDGVAALRSGVIEDGGLTWVSATVVGEGTISFWWKTSSELVRKTKDYVSFLVDDVEQAWMAGITDWSNVVCNITGTGTHTLKWVYQKNNNGAIQGEDCAWLDEVELIDWNETGASRWPIVYENLKGAENPNPGKYYEGTPLEFLPLADVTGYSFAGWTPPQIMAEMTGVQTVTANWSWTPQDVTVEASVAGGKSFEVKGQWASEELDRRFGSGTKQAFVEKFGDNLSLAMSKKTGKRDRSGNDLCVWHDYVAGTDPTDVDSVFRAEIEMADGLPVISWSPNLNSESEERVYLVYGKEQLADAWHLPINELDRFFKVEVSMPFDNSIVFDSNGGSSIDSVSIRVGQSVGELPTPIREGYTFAGWWTAIGGGMPITAETIVTNDMALFAHWKINTYTITFIEYTANGFSSSTVRTRTYGSTLGSLPTPTREGYAFDGWWTAASGGTQVSASTTVTGDVTYYAHWTKNHDIADGVEATDFAWTTGGEAGWLWQSEVSHDGEDAVSSGVISNNETSWMQTTVAGPAEVSFWWRVSSESGYDKLKFYIDDSEQTSISGETSWEQKTYTLASGNHTLKWEYSKDVSVDRGSDCGWVDQVTILPKNPTNNDANGSHDSVQLWEGGPYWATTNIGAEKPEDYGYYFWWGDTVGYRRENDKWVASDGSNSDFSFGSGNAPTSFKSNSTLQEEGWITSNGVLAPEHDAASVHWGNGWRLPTKEELDALGSNCDWIWTVKNGVNGYVVRGKGEYSSNSIFLPCAGTGDYSSASDLGSSGGCWSSVPNPSYVNGAASWFISFNLSGPSTNSYRNRWSAQSIRPVREVSSSNILSMSGLKAAYFFDGKVCEGPTPLVW